jgi:hypothetical protein
MKNVTITLDEETARWARLQAAKRGTSVSRLVGEVLRERREQESAYEAAMERFFGRKAGILKAADDRYPGRDSLYDRSLLR